MFLYVQDQSQQPLVPFRYCMPKLLLCLHPERQPSSLKTQHLFTKQIPELLKEQEEHKTWSVQIEVGITPPPPQTA